MQKRIQDNFTCKRTHMYEVIMYIYSYYINYIHIYTNIHLWKQNIQKDIIHNVMSRTLQKVVHNSFLLKPKSISCITFYLLSNYFASGIIQSSSLLWIIHTLKHMWVKCNIHPYTESITQTCQCYGPLPPPGYRGCAYLDTWW